MSKSFYEDWSTLSWNIHVQPNNYNNNYLKVTVILHSLITKFSSLPLNFSSLSKTPLGKEKCDITCFLRRNIKFDDIYHLKSSHYYGPVL